jgi:UDP-N-acetylmuramoyl-tripeptide--D-alanyl-D-alanine ligase
MTSAAVAAGFPSKQAVAVADKTDAVALVRAGLRAGDVVLVKASRGLALETVADDILTAVDRDGEEESG